MSIFSIPLLVAAVAVACFGAMAQAAEPAAGDVADLVRNGDFSAGAEGKAPEHWAPWLPDWQPAACEIRKTADGLLVEAPGRPFGVGGVRQRLEGFREGKAYAVDVTCRAKGIADPLRSLLVRLTWMKGDKLLHPAGWLAGQVPTKGGEVAFHDVLVVPRGADAAMLSLEVKWPGGGSVVWRRAAVTPTETPRPRVARIGTVYLRPQNSTPEKNLALWCEKIDQAGKLKLDAVCLCEAILQVGTTRGPADTAEAIPGPSTEQLGRAAKRNRLWVVAGLMERAGEALYNTAVLIDREGKLAGTYRKVHLPREEWKKGVTPGGDYPVFRTDFGTVAIQICYDWFFPEAAEVFALRGAEVLFAPTWGTTFADRVGRAEGETVFRVRARDNGLYLVPSVYDGSSMVIDPLGRVLATSNGDHEGVYWAEVDLAQRDRLWWVGHWRSIGPRHRMPGTYGDLTKASGPASR